MVVVVVVPWTEMDILLDIPEAQQPHQLQHRNIQSSPKQPKKAPWTPDVSLGTSLWGRLSGDGSLGTSLGHIAHLGPWLDGDQVLSRTCAGR